MVLVITFLSSRIKQWFQTSQSPTSTLESFAKVNNADSDAGHGDFKFILFQERIATFLFPH